MSKITIYRKKEPCKHEEAYIFNNGDWQWLKCRRCDKEVKPENYEDTPTEIEGPE